MKRSTRLVIQTIPTVGAISLAACVPTRGGGGGGGGGGSATLIGAWELRTYDYDGQVYTYPTSYTDDDGCTSTAAYFLQVDSMTEASMTGGQSYEGCEYYSEAYVYRYPGAAEDLGTGIVRIVIDGLGLTMDCPQNPSGSDMLCTSEVDNTGDDDDATTDDPEARVTIEVGFQRTSASNIPEPTVDNTDGEDAM